MVGCLDEKKEIPQFNNETKMKQHVKINNGQSTRQPNNKNNKKQKKK